MDKQLLKDWEVATSKLSWGVQKVFRDALSLVSEEKVILVYQADYSDGSPCLVNSVANMLTTSGGHGVPMRHFGEVVSLFDRINLDLRHEGVNSPGNFVSPLAADVLLRAFCAEQPKPINVEVDEATRAEAFANNQHYVEPDDEDFARDWLNSLQEEAPEDEGSDIAAIQNLLKHNGNI